MVPLPQLECHLYAEENIMDELVIHEIYELYDDSWISEMPKSDLLT